MKILNKKNIKIALMLSCFIMLLCLGDKDSFAQAFSPEFEELDFPEEFFEQEDSRYQISPRVQAEIDENAMKNLQFVPPKPKVIQVKLADFDKEVVQSKKPVIVDFTSKWCNPCKKIYPHFEQLSLAYPQLKFVAYDVDQDGGLGTGVKCQKYNVHGIPQFLFFFQGQEHTAFRVVGNFPIKLKDGINIFLQDVVYNQPPMPPEYESFEQKYESLKEEEPEEHFFEMLFNRFRQGLF